MIAAHINTKHHVKNEDYSGEKLNILCLHGKSQNKEVFRTRLGRIPHKCKDVAVFYCDVEAPHDLPLVEGGILLIKRSPFKYPFLIKLIHDL